MKKFQFRLETLLNYRKQVERTAKQSVIRTQKKISDCASRIQIHKTNQAKSFSELNIKMSSGINSEKLESYTSYQSALAGAIEKENQQREALLKELALKLETLKQRSVEKKAIENLKGRKKEAYYKLMSESLLKEAEDMIIMRQARESNQ